MDKFTGYMKAMSEMSAEEKQKDLAGKKTLCICGRCPTYDVCAKKKGELLFCLQGQSACTLTKKICLCPACPVTEKAGLEHQYFCIRGTEKIQRGM